MALQSLAEYVMCNLRLYSIESTLQKKAVARDLISSVLRHNAFVELSLNAKKNYANWRMHTKVIQLANLK